MPRTRHQLLEVELVDEDDAPPEGDADRAVPPRWRAALAAVPRRLWAGALVVALAAGGAASVVRHLDDRALDARLAGVPGLSVSLAGPLTEAWRAEGSGVLAVTDDLALVWGAGHESVTAHDLGTGATAFTVPGTCELVLGGPGDPEVTTRAVVQSAGPDDLLVCVERGGAPFTGAGPAVARVHTVDGELRREITMPATESWLVVGTDLVALGIDLGRHVVAGRWSLDTGEPRWTYRSTEPVPATGDGWTSSVGESVVGYQLGDWSELVDATTGVTVTAEVAPDLDGGTWGPIVTEDGLTLSGRFFPEGRTETTVDPARAQPFTVPGFVLPVAVDDGTADGVLLASRPTRTGAGSTLLAVDAATGRTRWTAEIAVGQLLALSGLLVTHDAVAITALDASTGRARWVAGTGAPDDGSVSGWGLLTDGRHVLTVDRAQDEWALVARELVTGEVRWTAPSPIGGGGLSQLPDGTVVLATVDQVVALRP